MKDHIVRRLCCGCMEAAADASSSPHPVYIEMSPSSPRPPAFFSSLDPTVSPAISCTSTRMTKSTSISNIISSRSLATYFKVEEEPKRAQEKGFKKLVSEWPAPHVTVKPLSSVVIVPAPSTDPSSSVSPTIFPPQFHGNLQPGPTNEPSPLEKHREEHVTDSTGTSTSQNKAPGTFLLADKNWAAGYVLASPSSPSADPVRESFIARLVEGVQVAMHSHTGHSRIQLLCTLDGAETFTWREGEAGNQVAHMEHWSSAGSGIFWGARESYAFGDIIEVRRGITPDLSNPGETGTASLRAACKNRDLSRSFSLITADGTIYLSCEQVETASLLVKGFMALSHEQRRRRVRRSSCERGLGKREKGEVNYSIERKEK